MYDIGYNTYIVDVRYRTKESKMHYLEAGKYTSLSGEINSLYHEAAVKMGISDSVMNILYVIYEKGDSCLQSEISKLSGISRQTINSSVKKLEKDEILYLKQGQGRNTIVCLTEKGLKFCENKDFQEFHCKIISIRQVRIAARVWSLDLNITETIEI